MTEMQSRYTMPSADYQDEDYFGQNCVCSLTPTEFELYCKKVLEGYAEDEDLKDFKIEHDVKLNSADGVYQIDVYARCTALGAEIKFICECKQYSRKVSREKVAVLADKLRSLGANKGILLSTSGFQSGAIAYAKDHGIELVQVFDTHENWLSHFGGGIEVREDSDPYLYVEKHWPRYVAKIIDNEQCRTIYPTNRMVEEIYNEMAQLTEKMYGIQMDLSNSKSHHND